MQVFRQLEAYYQGERRLLIIAIASLLTCTAAGLAYPMLLGYLIDHVIVPGRYELVPYVAGVVVLTAAFKAAMAFVFGHFGGRFGNRVAYNLRKGIYAKLQTLSFSYYDKAKTGDIMSRVTSDLDTVRHFASYELPHIYNYFACIVFSMGLMLSVSWPLTLYVMAIMPFITFLAVRFQNRVQPAFRSVRATVGRLTSMVQENIAGIRTVKAFAREEQQSGTLQQRSGEYRQANTDAADVVSVYFPLMEFTANVSMIIMAGAGGWLVLRGDLSVGELVAFFSIIGYMIGPLWHTGYHINIYTQTKASAERIVEILHQRVQIKDADDAESLDAGEVFGAVELDGVTFAYDGKQPALRGIDLSVPPGAVVGLLGPTGSGKSTLLQLLFRAYDPAEGRILLDGRDIRTLRLRDLRSQIAIVFQESFLFSTTILGNISFGVEDADMEQIVRAARLAQAHDFIMELPEGYQTIVGEKGLGLSGGQKQRIALARALLKEPKLLLLDDATSAVDAETEQRMQESLRQLRGCTTFIVSHRISSLQHADAILVLDGGRIVQRGTHRSLLAELGLYADTFRLQHGAEADVPSGEGRAS